MTREGRGFFLSLPALFKMELFNPANRREKIMTMQQFIEENREKLIEFIERIARIDSIDTSFNEDREIELWILNDEGLYLWALESGVDV